jgi:hypothetical protein
VSLHVEPRPFSVTARVDAFASSLVRQTVRQVENGIVRVQLAVNIRDQVRRQIEPKSFV